VAGETAVTSDALNRSSTGRYAAQPQDGGHQDGHATDSDTNALTDQMRKDIEQTRSEMAETIEALEERLRPGRLAADATERVKTAAREKVRDMADSASDTAQEMMDYTRDAADTMADTMRQNPIPAAMVGIGAAWWLMSQTRSRQASVDVYRGRDTNARRSAERGQYGSSRADEFRGYGGRRPASAGADQGFVDRLISNPIPTAMATAGLTWLAMSSRSDTAASYGRHRTWQEPARANRRPDGAAGVSERTERTTLDTVTESAEALTNRTRAYATEVASQAQEYAGEVGEAVSYTGRQAQNQLQRLMRTNPLLVGAGALAIGAAIGVMAPETESENEWMGEARETMVDRAEDMARTAASRVQDAAGEMVGEVASRIISGEKS